jgi:ribosome biogenesis GTPase / thiamine phosphate phosphatase
MWVKGIIRALRQSLNVCLSKLQLLGVSQLFFIHPFLGYNPMAATTYNMLGTVLTYHSNFYYVQVADTGHLYACFVRAVLKKGGQTVWVGDRVTIEPCPLQDSGMPPSRLPVTGTAWITDVAPRRTQVTRPKVANVSQILVLHPVSPQGDVLDVQALDRTLLHIGLTGLTAIIILTKQDLATTPVQQQALRTLAELYSQLGYAVFCTSTHQPDSIQPLWPLLQGQVTVLAGVSGAGKSSLLNQISPHWRLKTAQTLTELGTHTTRTVQLLPLPNFTPNGTAHASLGWVADTPGFRLHSFEKTSPTALAQALPEAQAHTCGFADCLHLDETDCAIKHTMDPQRYAHYVQFQAEAAAYAQTVLATSQKLEGRTKTLDKGKQALTHITRLSRGQRSESRRHQKQTAIQLLHPDALASPDDNEDETPALP